MQQLIFEYKFKRFDIFNLILFQFHLREPKSIDWNFCNNECRDIEFAMVCFCRGGNNFENI